AAVATRLDVPVVAVELVPGHHEAAGAVHAHAGTGVPAVRVVDVSVAQVVLLGVVLCGVDGGVAVLVGPLVGDDEAAVRCRRDARGLLGVHRIHRQVEGGDVAPEASGGQDVPAGGVVLRPADDEVAAGQHGDVGVVVVVAGIVDFNIAREQRAVS